MTTDSPSLQFYLVSGQSELFAIEQDWLQLIDDCASSDLMVEPRWLLTWWRNYGAGAEVAVGLLYDGNQLVGLAPLCIRKYAYHAFLVFKRLQFMGRDANEKDGVGSTYMNFIARAGYEKAVINAFADRIASGGFGQFDEVVLGGLNAGANLAGEANKRWTDQGFNSNFIQEDSRAFVQLPGTWDAYLQSLAPSCRDAINGALAAFEDWAETQGGWTIECTANPQALNGAFDRLMELRWNGDKGEHAYSSPRFSAFHHDYLKSASPDSNVEMTWLKVGGMPVAGIYAICNRKKVLAYHYGRAASLPAGIQVEIVANALMMRQAISQGVREFDLFGGEASFNSIFSNAERPIVSLRAARLTWREIIRLNLINLKSAIRSSIRAGRSLPGKAALVTDLRRPAQR